MTKNIKNAESPKNEVFAEIPAENLKAENSTRGVETGVENENSTRGVEMGVENDAAGEEPSPTGVAETVISE